MAQITASMKIDRLMRDLQQIPGAVDRTLRPWLLKNARATVSSSGKIKGIVQATPPFKLNESGDKASTAKARGIAAVQRDIKRVYAGPSALYAIIKQRNPAAAAGFWKHVKAGRMEEANTIARNTINRELTPFDGGTEHQHRRSKTTGRVKGEEPTAFTTDTKAIDRYIKAKQKMVGLLASSVLAAARSTLGKISAVPAWVNRHSTAWGSVIERGSDTDRTITIRMSAAYGMRDMLRRLTTVRDFRLRAMAREIPTILRHGLRQHLPPSLQ